MQEDNVRNDWEGLQATSGPSAVAKAQATADAAAAEVALERTKARDLSVEVADLRKQLDVVQQRHATAAAAAQVAEKHQEELKSRAQGLEDTVQRLEAAAKAVSERTAVERSAQVHLLARFRLCIHCRVTMNAIIKPLPHQVWLQFLSTGRDPPKGAVSATELCYKRS